MSIVYPDIANLPDLRIAKNSTARDAGSWLTGVAGANGLSDTFVVDDANFFTDGWGIIEGDLIQIEGQRKTVRIVKVNYESREITTDRQVELTKGSGVALAFSGLAPDLGAYEYE